jgi:WD40 repeat protein
MERGTEYGFLPALRERLTGPGAPFLFADAASDVEEEGVEEEEEESRGYWRCFKGHQNQTTSKNVSWMGSRGEHVVSGSDDGNVYIWRTDTGQLLKVAKTSGAKAVSHVKVSKRGAGCQTVYVTKADACR